MSKKKHRTLRKKGLPPGTLVYTGHRPASPVIVKSVLFSETELLERDELQADFLKNKNAVIWFDLRGLNDLPVIEKTGALLEIHPLALEDVLDTSQRAKLEEYENGLFFILNNLKLDPETFELTTEQISIFCGKNFVVSFQEDPDDTLLPVLTRIREARGRIRKKGSDFLTYALIDTIVDHYYLLVDELDVAIGDLDSSLADGHITLEAKRKLFKLRHLLNQFRKHVAPLREAALRFHRTDSFVVDDSNRIYFRDVSDHVQQILDSIDNFREILISQQELYLTEVSNRMNNVMRLLAVISTIFMPLSFITGIYGMNFDYMPMLHNPYGFIILAGLMAVVMIGMLIYFRVRKWI